MKLSEFLNQQNIQPTVFAVRHNFAPSTITRLLNGERNPRLDLLMKIRQATGGVVTLDDLADEFGKAEPEEA